MKKIFPFSKNKKTLIKQKKSNDQKAYNLITIDVKSNRQQTT